MPRTSPADTELNVHQEDKQISMSILYLNPSDIRVMCTFIKEEFVKHAEINHPQT